MANKKFKIGMLTVLLAFGLVMSGCDTSGGGSGSGDTATYKGTSADGSSYTLTISKSTEKAYKPAAGDKYVLTSGAKKSTGVVQKLDGSGDNIAITLSPSKGGSQFTTKVSSTGITGFSGSSGSGSGTVPITWDDGSTATLPPAVTPANDSGTGGGGTGGGDNSGTVSGSDLNGTWVGNRDGQSAKLILNYPAFSIVAPGMNETGTYTVSGSTITFTPSTPGSGSGTGTIISRNALTIDFGDKDGPYLVTFNKQ
ncbi:MAG: hypothetical protein LBB47_04195 [Spirochaetaceae bacterium]|jgi:hypothetical protein|nr:hypothetical protein [Spirochaetaceae bacterium]